MLPKILKIERNKKGLSQMAFSKILGISQQTVGSWETGRTSPDLDMLVKIAEFFNTSTDYLLGIKQQATLAETSTLFICSDEEQALISKFRKLSERAKIKIEARIDAEYDLMMEEKHKASKDA